MNRFFLLLVAVFISITAIAQPASKNYLSFKKGDLKEFLSYGEDRIPMVSAHRGGRYLEGYPENAIETFDYVLNQTPAIIEFDVRMSKDSVLLLMHDRSLDRTTNGSGRVENKTWAEMENLTLVDDFENATKFKIPTFEDALKWMKGKTIATVDVKRGVPFDKVIEMVERYGLEDYAVIITYNVSDAKKVYELNPDLMISASVRNLDELERIKVSGIPTENIIAFTGTRQAGKALYVNLHQLNITCILGTMGNLDNKAKAKGDEVYQGFIDGGADIIATDFPISASKAIAPKVDAKSTRMKFFK